MTRALRVLAALLVVATVGMLTSVAWIVRPGAEVFRLVRTDTAEHRWTPDKPLWVLLLGDDRRGRTGCGCSDAVHLVGVPAGGGSAVMLNLPRDLRVAIKGKGQRRVNEAYAIGGPSLAADTVGQLVGVPVSYVLVTTFGGLRSMVDELGGVDVNLPSRIRDRNVGLDAGPGVVRLDGAQALAYARSRKTFPDGDIQRTKNQGLLMVSVLAKLRSEGSSPTDTVRYLATFIRHTRIQGGGTTELFRLGRMALAVDPMQIRSVTPPVKGVMVSGQSQLELLPAAKALFADLADDALLSR